MSIGVLEGARIEAWFLTSENNAFLATTPSPLDEDGWYSASWNLTAAAMPGGELEETSKPEWEFPDAGVKPMTVRADDPARQKVLPNGITVYGDEAQQLRLEREVVDRFPDLWVDKGTTVDQPAERLMTVPLRDDWEKEKLPTRPYPVSGRDRKAIDKVLDKLHDDGKVRWTSSHSSFGLPVFVVWRNDKPRVVVDVRGLNRLCRKDSYPVPDQQTMLGRMLGMNYITTSDGVSFFFQWGVKPEDQEKFTVVSHRGQETFEVALMGYINSIQHVQREMDDILRPYNDCAQAYIDDVTIFSESRHSWVFRASLFWARGSTPSALQLMSRRELLFRS